MWKRGKLSFIILAIQVVLLIFFVLKGKYGKDADASNPAHNYAPSLGGQDPKDNSIGQEFDRLMESLKLLLLVFGMSISYTKTYLLSGIGLNLLLCCIVIQVSLVCQLLNHNEIFVDVNRLKHSVSSGVASALTLTSLHGKLSSLQLFCLVFFETVLYEMNVKVVNNFHVHDLTPGLKVVVFGSFFGVAACLSSLPRKGYKFETSSTNYFLCVLSSICSFLFWPSFLSGSSLGDKKHRIVVNVLLSMMGATVAAFATTSLVDTDNKFSPRIIGLGVTSGAVIVSSIAGLMLYPSGSIAFGMISSLITTVSVYKLMPFLVRKVKIQDCFHVFSSLCIPSVLSGILSSIYSLIADEKEYGVSLYEVFPSRSPRSNTSELEEILWLLSRVEPGLGLTAAQQAVNQLLALGTTVILAVLSGALIGLLVRIPLFDPLEKIMDDSCHWQISSIEVLLTGAESNFDLEATNHSLQVPRLKRMRAKVNG